MSRAQELLNAATPLPWKWRIEDGVSGSAEVYASGDDYITYVAPENAALIVYAVNALPAYEAAVEKLEWLLPIVKDEWDKGIVDNVNRRHGYRVMDEARAALARLRDEVPA